MCLELAPIFVDLASSFGPKSSVKFGEVDATVELKLADLFNIQRYPTLILYGSCSCDVAICSVFTTFVSIAFEVNVVMS